MSRRELLRGSLGAGVGLWLLEITAGTIGFLWPNLSGGFGGADQDRRRSTTSSSQNCALPIDEGFPAYYPEARAFVMLIDSGAAALPGRRGPTGDGTALNVRALYQRCPHLGCKPNPCLKNFWFECPCHGSRYDRLGHQGRRRAVRPGAARAWTASRPPSTATASSPSTPARSPLARCPSRSASPGSSRPARRPAASERDRPPPDPRRPMTDTPGGRPPEQRLPATRPSAEPAPAERFTRAARGAQPRADARARRARSSGSRRAPAGSASWRSSS